MHKAPVGPWVYFRDINPNGPDDWLRWYDALRKSATVAGLGTRRPTKCNCNFSCNRNRNRNRNRSNTALHYATGPPDGTEEEKGPSSVLVPGRRGTPSFHVDQPPN